jgi:hypothetical protein
MSKCLQAESCDVVLILYLLYDEHMIKGALHFTDLTALERILRFAKCNIRPRYNRRPALFLRGDLTRFDFTISCFSTSNADTPKAIKPPVRRQAGVDAVQSTAVRHNAANRSRIKDVTCRRLIISERRHARTTITDDALRLALAGDFRRLPRTARSEQRLKGWAGSFALAIQRLR